MGLDYVIKVHIKDKDTGITQFEMTCAHWRKCWNISKCLHNEVFGSGRFNVPNKFITCGKDDFMCSPNVIHEVVSVLLDKLKTCNLNSDLWTAQVWTHTETRDMTIINLANLFALDAWINDNYDEDAWKFCNDERLLPEWAESYINEKDKYQIVIESIFSY